MSHNKHKHGQTETHSGQQESTHALAYRFWEEAGRPEGQSARFWKEAEERIKQLRRSAAV
jgi:hypothetical protein